MQPFQRRPPPRFIPPNSRLGTIFKHQTLWLSVLVLCQIWGRIQTFSPPLQTNSQSGHQLPKGTASCFLIVATHGSCDSPKNLCLEGNTDVCSRWASSLLLTPTPGVCSRRELDERLPAFKSPKAGGMSHFSQLTRTTPRMPNTALAAVSIEEGGLSHSLLQRSPAQLKDLLQMKGYAWRGEGWQAKTAVSLPAANLY